MKILTKEEVLEIQKQKYKSTIGDVIEKINKCLIADHREVWLDDYEYKIFLVEVVKDLADSGWEVNDDGYTRREVWRNHRFINESVHSIVFKRIEEDEIDKQTRIRII